MRLFPKRKPASDTLPGFWPSERLFYDTAQSFVFEHEDGWEVSTRPPGHRFVAWELAVRYETACQLADAHYTQICDGPTDEEFAVRVVEIERLLGEADRLSQLERSIRPALPDDATAIRLLSSSPRPQPIMPETSRLASLAHDHLPDYVNVSIKLAQLEATSPPFSPQVHDFLIGVDRQIPGAGIHTAVREGSDECDYPFDYEFEAVLRPLRYVPVNLSLAWSDPIHVRVVVQMSTAHLEGCFKKALGKSIAKRPLGTIIRTSAAKKLMPSDLLAGVDEFVQLVGNPSKHDFSNDRSRGSVFIYEDAVLAYFLARHFGAAALEAGGQLDDLVAAVEDATRHDRYFRGAQLPIHSR